MALVAPVIKDISKEGSVQLVTWTLTTADHTGVGIEATPWADRSVMVQSVAYGTSTTGLEGSNDGSVWVALADPQGTAISKTADSVEAILELTRYMRPRLTVVGTAATVTVSMLLRRMQPHRT